MSNHVDEVKALAILPAAVQTRAAAVPSDQAQALVPAVEAMWPKDMASNPVLARAIARVAIAYGLDPLTGEVLPLGGKIYVSFEGRLRKAMEHAQYAGMECRPATEDERAAFRAADADHLWRCEVYRRDWLKPAVGWGKVASNDPNPVARQHPQNVAEKRAKSRALRDAFSIPLPSAEDAGDYEPGAVRDTRPGGMLASRGQIAAIHVLCKDLEVSDDDRGRLLEQMFGRLHSNELTEGEAATCLEHLAQLAEQRRANTPEAIAQRQREQAYLQTPRAASHRFHTARPEPAPATTEPPAEAEYEEIQAEGEPPNPARADLLRRIGAKPRPNWSEKQRAAALRAYGDALLNAGFDTDQVKAGLCAVHYAQTGEDIPLNEIKAGVSLQALAILENPTDLDIRALREMAEGWLAGERSGINS